MAVSVDFKKINISQYAHEKGRDSGMLSKILTILNDH